MIAPKDIQPFGDAAILLSWEQKIDEVLHVEIIKYDALLHQQYSKEILETVVSYASIAVYLKKGVSPISFIEVLKRLSIVSTKTASSQKKVVCKIPVCYHNSFGLDIEELANSSGLSVSEVVKIHTSPLYRVYFIGFLPGFPYLGGLDKRLYTPRKETPRSVIEAGSVAIGGEQTGIYPVNSPGGWNIIGKTPLQLFNPSKDHITLFKAGDYIQFYEVSLTEFNDILLQVESNTFTVEKEVQDV
ncbi:5-oxoprolinase subunit PxpB [Patiriisocius hiemis]|uniref:5-oxoprolinase subunit PxpB n=1 Tax=Patiriisocius hiemis TaxID=3075604 RepID=A0ABU2YA45_9FLAO|nr:5-oxoprolinase subunit PxpB [Constantimarinum sp. W242]MDT0555067.1 5-oxoprolinase subunit PxpB [Constantimarinum sp. W242]